MTGATWGSAVQDYIAAVSRKVSTALDIVDAARMKIVETGLAKKCIQVGPLVPLRPRPPTTLDATPRALPRNPGFPPSRYIHCVLAICYTAEILDPTLLKHFLCFCSVNI